MIKQSLRRVNILFRRKVNWIPMEFQINKNGINPCDKIVNTTRQGYNNTMDIHVQLYDDIRIYFISSFDVFCSN